MAHRRARTRIALNIGLDAVLAAAAVPLADWLAAPERMPLPPLASSLAGAAALLLAGLPFRLSLQYWRFAGVGELIGVAAASVLGAALFALGLHLAHVPLPSPSFPVGLALCLLVLLALPRMGYRLLREAPSPAASATPERTPVLLLGAGEAADRFLSALADPRAAYRAVGLLSGGGAQTGRRIQGCPVLGSLAEAGPVLERLRGTDEAPAALVITDPALGGPALEGVLALAARLRLEVVEAPRMAAPGFATAGGA